MNEIIKKHFPSEFTADVTKVVEAMAFQRGKGVELLGSMSQAKQLYSNDYDLFQTVKLSESTNEEAVLKIVAEFKAIVRNLLSMNNIYVGDIKCGSINDWIVIPDSAKIKNNKVIGYNALQCKEKLNQLLSKRIITKSEFDKSVSLLVLHPTPEQFLEIQNEIRFNIVRWKPKDILNGYVELKGIRYTLQEGITSKSLTKMDIVAFIEKTHYADFSIIYEFENNGKSLNGLKADFKNDLQSDVLFYLSKGAYYKTAKRMYSLAKFKNNTTVMNKLLTVINDSQLGLLYVVCGDITTLLWILDNVKNINTKRIEYEIDQFKTKLSNIHASKDFQDNRSDIFQVINNLASETMGSTSRKQMKTELTELLEKLSKIVNDSTKEALKKVGLLPLLPSFKP